MKKSLLLLASLPILALGAIPDVTSIEVSQEASTRNIEVDYTLAGAAAVITIEFYTNNVKVATGWNSMVGDVNKLVQTGDRTIKWHPDNTGLYGSIANLKAHVIAWPVDKPPKYMVLDLKPPMQRFYYDSVEEIPFGPTNDLYRGDWVIFRKIPAAGVKWRMGGGSNEVGTVENEYWKVDYRRSETHHWVELSEDYYIAIFEMTQQQMSSIQGGTATVSSPYVPSVYTYNNLRGSVDDGIDWPKTGSSVKTGSVLDKARDYTGISTLDLPTESEWEYACRAGTSTAFYDGTNLNHPRGKLPAEMGWTSCDSARYGRTYPGQLQPNGWGLYDMYGNMAEICLDWYNETQYESREESYVDPKGPNSDDDCAPTLRVKRGGSFFDGRGTHFRSGRRCGSNPASATHPTQTTIYEIGFRLKCAARAD